MQHIYSSFKVGMHPVSSQENSLTKGELVLILQKKKAVFHFLTQYNSLIKQNQIHFTITGDTFYFTKHFRDKTL